ncbi:hypothetical protein SEUCBS139899_004084 [Sporothrix eucalyptigena]|uniref:Uncharacterized protein n=1 Tax=Sporothrix eucalyptigena TaxID=1812306 RepID=A0ABP0BEP0_9PEZI
MTRSFKTRQYAGKSMQTPANWNTLVPHKYCGALDSGRVGKDNKAHRCAACLSVKAQMDTANDRAKKWRREEKMNWVANDD